VTDAGSLEARLGRVLAGWVCASAHHRRTIGVGALLLFVSALVYTVGHLGIRSDNEALFPEDLPFRLRDQRFLEAFPELDENVTLVVEGPFAEVTRDATLRLAARLRGEPSLFPRVHLPADPFFERNGLLYLEISELEDLADRLSRLQPLLAGLVKDESLPGLMDQTRDALAATHDDMIGEVEVEPILRRIEDTLRATLEGGEAALDWSSIVDWGPTTGNPRRRVLQVRPRLDYGALAAAETAIEAIETIAREEGIDGTEGLRLRMTGDMVLNMDEMGLLRGQVAWAGVGSFFVVAALLQAALRSARGVLATVTSLLFGLALTAGFATLAIGHLNMISVAFAVLFIGLGVDFGIHLCMRFGELRARGVEAASALEESARGVGSSLMLCAVTTAVGFFAFVPTEFIGVAELGVIAGVGMFVGVASSFTIIPAILIGDVGSTSAVGRPLPLRLPTWPISRAGLVCTVASLVAMAAVTQLPRLRFDQNPLNVRDPSASSVRVYQDLLSDSERSPWTLDVLADDAAEAAALADRFEAQVEVERARTLADYVPASQSAKLEIIEEMAYFANFDAIERSPRSESPEAAMRSLERLHEELSRLEPERLGPAVAQAAGSLEAVLAGLLERLGAAPPERRAAMLLDLERRLLAGFPDLLARIERAMSASAFGLPDLPQTLREAMVSHSGLHRVEIAPAEDLAQEGALDRFVAAGRRVTDELAGPAVRIHASARAVVGALREALASALVVILVFLLVLWRRPADVALVMLPLAWAGVLTGASMVVFGIPFNFADVIVLPLLLGIGVDSGIHMVHRARIRESREEVLLGTSTARAVVFSAMTTIASFGTLALVPHRGMANLGQLLVIGVSWTVVANLVLLPALLALRERWQAS
jgi:hopanoid biosynthesis associated RND transporter like protein HpnN